MTDYTPIFAVEISDSASGFRDLFVLLFSLFVKALYLSGLVPLCQEEF